MYNTEPSNPKAEMPGHGTYGFKFYFGKGKKKKEITTMGFFNRVLLFCQNNESHFQAFILTA